MEHSFNRPDLLQSNTTSVHIPIFVDDSSTIVSNSQLTVNSRTVYSQEHIPKAKRNISIDSCSRKKLNILFSK